MDMIANITNSTGAKLFHGSREMYANLWIDLAVQLAGPVAWGAHILLASNDGSLYAIEPQTGRIVWKQEFGIPLTSAPVVCGDRLVTTTPDATLWKFTLRSALLSL